LYFGGTLGLGDGYTVIIDCLRFGATFSGGHG
jgi:hypothetical protein